MSVRTDGWVRIEGAEIQNLYKEYGTFNRIPNELQHVYYGNVELQIENPYSSTHSSIYRVVPLDYFQIDSIEDLDQKWGTGGNYDLKENIQKILLGNDVNHIGTVDPTDNHTGYYYVGEPVVQDQSCVIFYDDSQKGSIAGSLYTHYTILLVDHKATPRVVKIKAEYKGNPVPVETAFKAEDISVTAVYDDGNEIPITSGYTIEPENRLITILGANKFTINYMDEDNELNTADILIEGVRNLQGITCAYEGTPMVYGKQVDKRFITVVAHYSDGFQKIVTDYTFPEGNTISVVNEGRIKIYFEGKENILEVPVIEIKKQRIIIHYNGPKVEVGKDILLQYVSPKMYYQSTDEIGRSWYEDIDIELCEVPETKITQEGINSFSLTFPEAVLGPIEGTFAVVGFSPEVVPRSIDATYTGPGIYVGKSISIERILCNIYYSDGTVVPTKQYTLDKYVIDEVGINDITVTYTEGGEIYKDVISIQGLENDTTTANNIFPTALTNKYPNATVLNNRYRGPAEGIKANDISMMITKNLQDLYEIFALLEKQYNEIVEYVTGQNSIKILTLNDVAYADYQLNTLLNDNHYSTGTYKSDKVVEE